MAMTPNTLTLNAAKLTSAAIGYFGLVFAMWIFYATLVMYPSDANFSIIGVVLYGVLATLGIGSAILGRLVWRRISGTTFETATIYRIASGMAILWFPLFLFSPSMVMFFLISVSLLVLHALFGRTRLSSASNR
jgi:hypothetical protein